MEHEFEPGSLMRAMGMKQISCSPTTCVLQMPVEGNRQVSGVLHGGATAALAETAASMAANAHARTLGPHRAAVGVELSIFHVRSVGGGLVTATATATHLGRTRTVHHVEIKNEDGEIISTALVSNQIIEVRA